MAKGVFMAAVDLEPMIKIFERLYVENLALRSVLNEREDWSDEQVNKAKKKYEPIVSQQFALVSSLLNKPHELRTVLEGILLKDRHN